jgi:hypothetical protein
MTAAVAAAGAGVVRAVFAAAADRNEYGQPKTADVTSKTGDSTAVMRSVMEYRGGRTMFRIFGGRPSMNLSKTVQG